MTQMDPYATAWADRHANALALIAPLVDQQLSPLGLETIKTLEPQAGDTILDVGCGAGQTLPQIAGYVGPSGRAVGVDIAPALLSIARNRTEDDPRIELIEADVQTLALPDGSFDGVFSRFGVMGFTDPVIAFSNLRRMLRPDGRLSFCCWRELDANELDHLPVRATGLEGHVRGVPFSFADPDHVHGLLERAGFHDVRMRSHDEPVSCGGLDETLDVLLSVGALGQIVRENPALHATAEPLLRAVLIERFGGSAISLTAAVWIVSASTGN